MERLQIDLVVESAVSKDVVIHVGIFCQCWACFRDTFFLKLYKQKSDWK